MVPALLLGGVGAIVSDLADWDLEMAIGGSGIEIPKDRYAGFFLIVLAGLIALALRYGHLITALLSRHRRAFLGGVAVAVVGLLFGGSALITMLDGGPAVSAAMEGDTDGLERMFASGQVHADDHDAMVMWAAQKGHVETMRLLMAHKLNPDAQRDDGLSALKAACSWGGADTVAVLKQAGATGDCS